MSDEQPFAPIDNLKFSDMLSQLELIVSKLESANIELEQSLVYYERGVALVCAMRERLDKADQKVTALIGQIETLDSQSVDSSLS